MLHVMWMVRPGLALVWAGAVFLAIPQGAEPPVNRLGYPELSAQMQASFPSMAPQSVAHLRQQSATPVSIAESTRGTPITIAGHVIQLPADAYIEALRVSVLCVVGMPCPETPSYIIRRGGSMISVGLQTGRINDEQTAPGESTTFVFLKEALGDRPPDQR
jgi:hypothetical protein